MRRRRRRRQGRGGREGVGRGRKKEGKRIKNMNNKMAINTYLSTIES